MDDLKQQLINRLNNNLSDYHDHLLEFEQREIIDMAARAAAMADMHMYLTTKYVFNESEIEYLLNFRNPLEVVTDAWETRLADLSDLDFIVQSVCDQQDALQDGYALMRNSSENGENGNEQHQENASIPCLPCYGADSVHGYEIKQSVMFTNDRGFALAENLNAVQPFVTWQLTEEQGEKTYYWGNYFSDAGKAAADFAKRVSEYKAQYKVEERKPSVMERLMAAQQVSQPEKKSKSRGSSKDEL